MARPKNSVKPLLPHTPTRPGRPAAPKLAIGLLGPDSNIAGLHDLEQAYAIGQAIAKLKQTTISQAFEGCGQLAAKGAKDQSGVSIGFSPAIGPLHHQQIDGAVSDGFDHLIYTNLSNPKSQQRLMASLEGLIIIPDKNYKDLPDFQLIDHPLVIGLLTKPDTPTDYVTNLVNQTTHLKTPIFYNNQGKKLVEDIITFLKTTVRNRESQSGSGF